MSKALGLLHAIGPLLKLRPRMPLRCVQALLLVSEYPGESVTELASRAKISIVTMSRNLLDIGPQTRKGEPGLGLVEARTHPDNASAYAYTLTSRGRAMVEQMMQHLQ